MDTGLLEQRLLVRVAGTLGPELDQIDVAMSPASVNVRDLLLEVCHGEGPRPVEVRVALANLGEQGLLVVSSEELRQPGDYVGLTMRGLLAARKIEPGCGMPTRLVTLTMRRSKRAGVFDARIDTGQGSDAGMNRSGVCLAAFYVIAAKLPSKDRPLMLAECEEYFSRLAALGVGPRSGKGDRLLATLESISEAFEQVSRSVVPLIRVSGGDGRQVGWFLAGEFPEVRIANASGGQFRDWTWMQLNLQNAIAGRPFPDAANNTVQPLTNEQVRELLAGRDAEQARRRGEKREAIERALQWKRARDEGELVTENADD